MAAFKIEQGEKNYISFEEESAPDGFRIHIKIQNGPDWQRISLKYQDAHILAKALSVLTGG